jgi:hypothetical protein
MAAQVVAFIGDLTYADDFVSSLLRFNSVQPVQSVRRDSGTLTSGGMLQNVEGGVLFAGTTKTQGEVLTTKWCARSACQEGSPFMCLAHKSRGANKTIWCAPRETMSRLLQRAGNGSSLPYMFLPGNHEVMPFA